MTRAYCFLCHRPESQCLCAAVSQQKTRLPVLIIQHPDESSHPFTTSRIATLGAQSVQLVSALDCSSDDVCAAIRSKTPTNFCLLYQNHSYTVHDTHNLDVCCRSSAAVIHNYDAVIVLDGTWRNTRELLLRNTWLAELDVLCLMGVSASEYQIRKSVKPGGICTIEAIGCLLEMAEEEFDRDAYLLPMRTLVQQQQGFSKKASSDRSRSLGDKTQRET